MIQNLRKKVTSSILFCLIGASVLCAEPGKLVLGGEAGWSALQSHDGITFTEGMHGKAALVLEDKRPAVSGSTDLFLSFDGQRVSDEAGNYTVRENSTRLTKPGFRGEGSALSNGDGGLVLEGKAGSIFGTNGYTGSFSIEFWLCPASVDSGEVVFAWDSARNLANYSSYQMINASFENNHLVWNFMNIFDTGSDDNLGYLLSGHTVLIPSQWSHHQLVYRDDTGLLEYLVNGRTEDLCFVTDTGRENGSVYPALLGVVSEVEVCPKYSGGIDNLLISRMEVDTAVRSASAFDQYSRSGATFQSELLCLGQDGARVTGIEIADTVPDQTAVEYRIRFADTPYGWTDTSPAWQPLVRGSVPAGGTATWCQISGTLYSDGAGKTSPLVHGITVSYETREPPYPPFSITAVPGNGSVTLTWNPSPSGGYGSSAVGGYLVYYGTRPGEYLGSVAVEGASPLDVGDVRSVTLHGLKNGTIYYFALAAYSVDAPRLYGTLSQEVYARPSRQRGANRSE